tara:strand:+ start:160 stop:543 length:384 start_codon:yes stop_codon:yes gene_type:complete
MEKATDIIFLHVGIATCSAYLLFIWFQTNAVLEYAKLLKLEGLFYIKEYEESLEIAPDITYAFFLLAHKDSFVNRLLSCPFCLGTWVIFYFGAMFSVIYGLKVLSFIFLDWFVALFLYKSFTNYFSE